MQPELECLRITDDGFASVLNFLKSKHRGFFSIINRDIVISKEQVNEAYVRSERFLRQSRVREREVLFMMLISGERQAVRAIKTAGISSGTESAVLVYDDAEDFSEFSGVCGACIRTEGTSGIPEVIESKDRDVFGKMVSVVLSF